MNDEIDNKSKENLILNKTIEFSLQIIAFSDLLQKINYRIIANQLLRSGTSIGANVWEAQAPESRADFVHKMKIAAKEASETEYWLILCNRSDNYPNCVELLKEVKSIQRIISKIISSSKNN